METFLKIYTFVDDTTSTPFPDAEEQIISSSVSYETSRMGSSPSMSITAKHRRILDSEWTGNEYVMFNGEMFFVYGTPSARKQNDDERYIYEINLYPYRRILDNVYFIDAVNPDDTEDTYKSNRTDIHFVGDINEFASRLSASMKRVGINYSVVVDEGITTEQKSVDITDKYFSEALQEIYNIYGLPYYFVGLVIHIGYSSNTVSHVFKYGHDDALISISHENQNYRIINRIKGHGSQDNIPYYYPNMTPRGEVGIFAKDTNTGATDEDCHVTNQTTFVKKVNTTDEICYDYLTPQDEEIGLWDDIGRGGFYISKGLGIYNGEPKLYFSLPGVATNAEGIITGSFYIHQKNIEVSFDVNISGDFTRRPNTIGDGIYPFYKKIKSLTLNLSITHKGSSLLKYNSSHTEPVNDNGVMGTPITFHMFTEHIVVLDEIGEYEVSGKIIVSTERGGTQNYYSYAINLTSSGFIFSNSSHISGGYTLNHDASNVYTGGDLGISVSNIHYGDVFYQKVLNYIEPSEYLLPPVYRDTLGEEMFYNAKNGTYLIPDSEDGEYYVFEDEYSESNRKEGTKDFEDIKPTIVGMVNSSGVRIDKFLDFAYDENDNDETDEYGDYIHPYFFAKLSKTDGENGFNLFEQANEKQTMQISFTAGDCAGCTFEIGVGNDTQKNTVQVDERGNLLRDAQGNVRRGTEDNPEVPQDRQNDTQNNEVWIALKKDDSSYSYVMPNVFRNYKPKAEDTFVILGITLPEAYIRNAENKLKEELIKYMWENNYEKFSFSIQFSRIFLGQNPDVLSEISENSSIIIEYNGNNYTLYVNGFTWNIDENSVLPEISVTLTDSLTVSKNSLEQTISGVLGGTLVGSMSSEVIAECLKRFLRRDVDDVAKGKITFDKGIRTNYDSQMYGDTTFGETSDSMTTGRGTLITEDGRIQTERIEVRGSMSVMDLIINEIHALAGDYSFTDAGSIDAVDDLGDSTYRLFIRRDTEFDVTSLDINDVLYSIVNNIKIGGTDYYTSWMRVIARNSNNNTLTVVLYPDEEVPGGQNYPPLAGYNLTRRGNSFIPQGEDINDRAQGWLISSREGRIMFLANVYKPILEDYNYATVVGKLPDINAMKHLAIPDNSTGVMAQYGIFEKFFHFDYNGDVVPTQVDRGDWSLEVAQSNKPYRYVESSVQESAGTTYTLLSQDTVFHNGCKWACLIDKTELEPKWNSQGWQLIEGDKNYYLVFDSTYGWNFLPNNVNTEVYALINYGTVDITDDVMSLDATEVEWTRDSGNAPLDSTWKPTLVDGKKNVLKLTNYDMPPNFGSTIRQVKFTCKVYIPDGEERKVVESFFGVMK